MKCHPKRYLCPPWGIPIEIFGNISLIQRQGIHNQPTTPDTSIPRIQQPTTTNPQCNSGDRTTQGRREDREGEQGTPVPPLGTDTLNLLHSK